MRYQMVGNKCLSPARGGDPDGMGHNYYGLLSVPRTRGWSGLGLVAKLGNNVCPPHAGVIQCTASD